MCDHNQTPHPPPYFQVNEPQQRTLPYKYDCWILSRGPPYMCIIMSYNLYSNFICYMVKSKLITPFGQPHRLIRVMKGAPPGVELACTTAKPLNLFFSKTLHCVHLFVVCSP